MDNFRISTVICRCAHVFQDLFEVLEKWSNLDRLPVYTMTISRRSCTGSWSSSSKKATILSFISAWGKVSAAGAFPTKSLHVSENWFGVGWENQSTFLKINLAQHSCVKLGILELYLLNVWLANSQCWICCWIMPNPVKVAMVAT